MGTVSSRGTSPSTPGSYSLDPAQFSKDAEQTSPLWTKNDDGVAPKDVIDQDFTCNHPGSLELIASEPSSLPPPRRGPHSTGLSETENLAYTHSRSTSNGPDIFSSSSSGTSSPQISRPTTPVEPSFLEDMATRIHFHSPSSEIVGTPYAATNATRFEYPFPSTSSASPSSTTPTAHSVPKASGLSSHFTSSTTSSLGLSIISPPSPGLFLSQSAPYLSTSCPSQASNLNAQVSLSLSLAGAAMSLALPDFSHSPPSSSSNQTNVGGPPRMQSLPIPMPSPPVPPSLLKKREGVIHAARRSTLDVLSAGHEPIDGGNGHSPLGRFNRGDGRNSKDARVDALKTAM